RDDLARESALFEAAADDEPNLFDVEGLGEVVVGAAPHRFHGHPHVPHRGGEHDDDRGIDGHEAWQHVDAALTRHPVVQHHEVDFVAAQHVQRLLAGRGVQYFAGVLEHHANGIAHTGFVVDD